MNINKSDIIITKDSESIPDPLISKNIITFFAPTDITVPEGSFTKVKLGVSVFINEPHTAMRFITEPILDSPIICAGMTNKFYINTSAPTYDIEVLLFTLNDIRLYYKSDNDYISINSFCRTICDRDGYGVAGRYEDAFVIKKGTAIAKAELYHYINYTADYTIKETDFKPQNKNSDIKVNAQSVLDTAPINLSTTSTGNANYRNTTLTGNANYRNDSITPVNTNIPNTVIATETIKRHENLYNVKIISGINPDGTMDSKEAKCAHIKAFDLNDLMNKAKEKFNLDECQSIFIEKL